MGQNGNGSTTRAIRILVIVSLLVANAPGARVGAEPITPAQRDAVQAHLRAHDEISSRRDLAVLGTGVDGVLVEIASDTKLDASLRSRAVSALGFFSTAASRAFLEATIKAGRASQPGEILLLRRAVVALGWQGGGGTASLVGPLLSHAEPDVRLDAALALGMLRTKEAAALLRRRIDLEPLPKVRLNMGRQLRVIEDALRAADANNRTGKDK